VDALTAGVTEAMEQQARVLGSARGGSAAAAAGVWLPAVSDTPLPRRKGSSAKRRYAGLTVAAAKPLLALDSLQMHAADSDNPTLALLAKIRSSRRAEECIDEPEREEDGVGGGGDDDSDGDVFGGDGSGADGDALAHMDVLAAAAGRCDEYAAARQRLFAARPEINQDLRAALLATFSALQAALGEADWVALVTSHLPSVTTDALLRGDA